MPWGLFALSAWARKPEKPACLEDVPESPWKSRTRGKAAALSYPVGRCSRKERDWQPWVKVTVLTCAKQTSAKVADKIRSLHTKWNRPYPEVCIKLITGRVVSERELPDGYGFFNHRRVAAVGVGDPSKIFELDFPA